jgi:alpha-ketoglutarate-dependent taurine dioxygenase
MRVDFEVRPLDPIGVEIAGLDLGRPMTDAGRARLRQVAMEQGLVLIREQPLEPREQVALARRFGVPEQGTFNEDSPDSELILLTNVDADGRMLSEDDVRMRLVRINEGWHTDSSFRPVPASFSFFSAVVVPEEGGDTLFASMQAAWQSLDESEQRSLYGLMGVHDYAKAFRLRGADIDGDPIFDLPPESHPLVRRHPETGANSLFVSEHVMGIEGWSDERARPLLAHLLGVVTAPERVYRHRWSVGDLLIWDNRSMLHCAQGFDSRHPRVMHHVRIEGTEPAIPAEPER